MIKAQFLLPLIIAINIIGLGLSLLYGRYGGSGGETTEGVFFGIKITGIIVVILVVMASVIYKEWLFKNWYFILLIVIVGLLQVFFLELIK